MSRRPLDPATRVTRRVWRDRDHEDLSPHSVYRIYDPSDRLLYIGCARDVDSRIYMHLQTLCNPSSMDVRRGYARHTSQEYPTKLAARAAERIAIAAEAPLLNRQHNPKRWRRVDGQYVPIS